MKRWAPVIFWVTFCELIGIAATPFTISAIPTWYASLVKPLFTPPDWVFGPAWIILYFLMGLAVSIIWKERNRKPIKSAMEMFYTQLGLNFLWSVLFFGLHSPILGLVNIIFLLIFIALTFLKFQKISHAAAYLLVPYFLWVSFATLLNFEVLVLNR